MMLTRSHDRLFLIGSLIVVCVLGCGEHSHTESIGLATDAPAPSLLLNAMESLTRQIGTEGVAVILLTLCISTVAFLSVALDYRLRRIAIEYAVTEKVSPSRWLLAVSVASLIPVYVAWLLPRNTTNSTPVDADAVAKPLPDDEASCSGIDDEHIEREAPATPTLIRRRQCQGHCLHSAGWTPVPDRKCNVDKNPRQRFFFCCRCGQLQAMNGTQLTPTDISWDNDSKRRTWANLVTARLHSRSRD